VEKYSRQFHVVRGQPRADHLNLPIDRHLSVPSPGFHSITEALNDLQLGKFVVVLDDENRENEGDLIICADRITSGQVAFMVEHTSGVICIGMEGGDLDRLRLPLMVNSTENEVSCVTDRSLCHIQLAML
jgi:3,4-dihydroxy 2-butanone 4-phosphate synthase/GTP cyclohydrolase II